MNAAGTRSPEAAGAEGTRLAPGSSSRLRRRGRPEDSQAVAAAPRGAGEWPAAGAPLRFLPAPPPGSHPGATPGLASGWWRRRRWAALLVFGLLVAGAAGGCELVPRHLRGRRVSGSAAATASSPAAAAGEIPALLTGEGPGGDGRGRRAAAGPLFQGGSRAPFRCPLFVGRGHCAMRCRAPGRPAACVLAASWSRTPTLRTLYIPPRPPAPALARASGCIRLPVLKSGSPVFHNKQCSGFSLVLRKSEQSLQATGLIFFCFIKLLEKISSNAVLNLPVVLLLQRQLAASLTGSKPC